jgi:hypothetical protein
VQWIDDTCVAVGAAVWLKKLNDTPPRRSKLVPEIRSAAAATVTDASPDGAADAVPAILA